MTKKIELTAIDIFCGCGGISCGLQQAGFKILAGADIEKKYNATFAHNFPTAKNLQLDLSKISPAEFMTLVDIKPGKLDLLAGGPPCQGFSKNVPRKFRRFDAANNLLIRTFLNYCDALKPRFILMENVAEMKNGFDHVYTDEILSHLEKEGYTVAHFVFNAADYGVPQRRRRTFFFGSFDGIKLNLPKPTHTKPPENPELFPSLPPHVTVWEAIGDLPSLKPGEQCHHYHFSSFSDFQKLMRIGQTKLFNHVARELKPKQYERLASLKPGQGHKDLPKHLQVKSAYSGAYGRLTKDMIAPTITRWVFHPGSGRWGHPVDNRTLSIREVARIQSFPDSFEFIGTYTQQAGQLGNAVPPLLIQKLAEQLLAQAGISS
jgi:DNA (cytosine-5)-methyltransferase 1